MTSLGNDVDFSLVLASSVHDMKNSVGMLIASLEHFVAEHPPQSQPQAEHLNILHYEASRINAELVQLLTIYRMQNGLLPLRVDRHFVRDVLDDQIARNHPLIESRNIEWKIECDDELEWYFDADLIGSVVHNLVVNAVRYTHTKILIIGEVAKNQLVLSVCDDGAGFPEAMLQTTQRQIESAQVSLGNTQLGLYFAEKIAAMHIQDGCRGTTQLENGKPLSGGCFSIVLP